MPAEKRLTDRQIKNSPPGKLYDASLKLPPLEFLCDKILPNSGLAMLAGAPKAGKSWQV